MGDRWSEVLVRSSSEGVLVQKLNGDRLHTEIRRRRVTSVEVSALLAQLEALNWQALESADLRGVRDYAGTRVSITLNGKSNRFEGRMCPGLPRPTDDDGCNQRLAADVIRGFALSAGVPWSPMPEPRGPPSWAKRRWTLTSWAMTSPIWLTAA
jgi:hypothetical protein